MLLCGDCEHRDGAKCNHPQLKENGGSGLKVNFAKTIISEAFICFSRERMDQIIVYMENGLPLNVRANASLNERAQIFTDPILVCGFAGRCLCVRGTWHK